MSKISNETLLKQMDWRYACKKFDKNKKISDADWQVLSESLRTAASSYGLQPWKFIVVQNPELRQQLLPVSWGQTPVTDCSHFIVITYKEKMDEAHIDKFLNQTAKVRNIDLAGLEGYRGMMKGDLVDGPRSQIINFWAQRQCYIAMGSLLTTAALMEIDALPMEGFDPSAYDKILGLEGTGYRAVAAIACGYRAEDDGYAKNKKVRFDMNDILSYR